MREESCWREFYYQWTAVSALIAKQLYIIGLAAVLFLFLYKFRPSTLVCSGPGCLPPSSHVPWAVGGVFPVFDSWCFGCVNGAWVPVCPLGGTADDLPVFGMHNRKAFAISWLNYKYVCADHHCAYQLFCRWCPYGRGGAHVLAYSFMHFHMPLLPRMP